MSNSKRALVSLQSEGTYLFHGSPHFLEELEPRQPRAWDEKTERMLPDGKPAVVATPFVDIAIFRAVIVADGWSAFGYDGQKFSFEASAKTLEQSTHAAGYAYVLQKDSFEKAHSMEWRSAGKVRPIKVITVDFADLPHNIQVVDR